MASYWLFKEEPSHYSFDNLLKDGKTVWDGVENNLALKYLRSVKKEEEAFFYHTGDEKAIVGIMKVVSDPYPDPKKQDKRYVVVDVVPVRKLKRPVTLQQVKKDKFFSGFELIRLPRLSVLPVSEKFWKRILEIAELQL
jgi:predicted RNA-binding protein with PUA-like domain